MKTYRHLYEQICTWDNLYTAYLKARQGKRRTPAIARFEYHQETELITLHQDLLAQTYQPGVYHSFYIHEPKRRLISAAPFRDRIVHHALCNLIEPIFERSFIHDSYANRVGKGTSAVDGLQTAPPPPIHQPNAPSGRSHHPSTQTSQVSKTCEVFCS